MRESVGKKVARRLFYLEYLPTWLSPERLRSGNFLVLLGKEQHELKLLQQINIPLHHVWSVEHDGSIYDVQNSWDSGVSLYCGEMADYLRNLLHHDEDVLVLNLDIEGSYLTHLDPAMTSILLFGWKNPETVIATYSSVGRDNQTLKEGLFSFAVLLWLVPDIALELCATLSNWFKQTGFSEPMTMVLREMFWIRSLLEHSILASVIAKKIPAEKARKFLEAEQMLWKGTMQGKPKQLRINELSKLVSKTAGTNSFIQKYGSAPQNLTLGITLEEFRHVFYNAQKPWNQLCHFVKLGRYKRTLTCREWLETVCGHMLVTPLTYINKVGKQVDIDNLDASMRGNPVVLRAADLYAFKPRKLIVKDSVPYFDPTRIDKREPIEIPDTSKEEEVKQGYVEKGKLSGAAKAKIKQFARNKNADTNHIMNVMGLPEKFRGSVTAHLANARRKEKK